MIRLRDREDYYEASVLDPSQSVIPKKIAILNLTNRDKIPPRLRYQCLMAYSIRPEQQSSYPVEWKTLKAPCFAELRLELRKALQNVQRERDAPPVAKKTAGKYQFRTLSEYDSLV
jgi:hypothetical protein